MNNIIKAIAHALEGQEYELTEQDLGQAYLQGTTAWVQWMKEVSMTRFNNRLRGLYRYNKLADVPVNELRRLHLDFVSGREGELAGFKLLTAFNPVENDRQSEQAYNHFDLSVEGIKLDIKLLAESSHERQRTTVSFSHFSKLSNMFKAHEPVGLLVMERFSKRLFKPALICSNKALQDALFVSQWNNDEEEYVPFHKKPINQLLAVNRDADPYVTILTGHSHAIQHLNHDLYVLNDKYRYKPT